MAKSSQTEPLGRRYSTGASKEREQDGEEQEGEEEDEEEEEEDEEEEAREQPEEKEKQGAGTSRPPAYPTLGANFQCNLCQISLNSQSQVAQVALSLLPTPNNNLHPPAHGIKQASPRGRPCYSPRCEAAREGGGAEGVQRKRDSHAQHVPPGLFLVYFQIPASFNS